MKLTAQELRIGNYIYAEGDIIKATISTLQTPEFYDPITLTEQWLIDFGFIKCNGWDDQVFYQKNRIDIFEWLSGYEYDDFNIKTVHQLQNFYFSLTGEELTLNE